MNQLVGNDQKPKMDPAQITALAKLLKESGDKVLNSQFKLSLSGSLLRALNDSFSLIVDKNEILPPQSFQVVKPNNAKSDVFRDLQFVYDFVQKTVILSLNQFVNDDPYEFAVDISKFRSLRTLEIQKIPVNQIVGLQHLRTQLHDLSCVRSISDVADVLLGCGGDKADEEKQWRSLESINFAYNTLDYVDSSLECTPWLKVLNLSHNQLVSVSAIRCLPNLRVLNLNFNRLNQVPAFHADAMRKMQVLQLSNNFLEDLEGLACLSGGLHELDLSGNCIVDHGALLPLSTLVALRSVNLLDNPLACHPKHRLATARYLNKATSGGKFVLDDEPLSRYEKTLTGNYDSYKAILVSSTISGPSLSSSGRNTPASSATTIAADGEYDSASGSFRRTIDERDLMNQSVTSQKKLRVRRALISEGDNEDPIVKESSMDASKSTSSINLESNREHLETKKALESLSQRYGNDWLQSQAGHLVRRVIGFDPSEPKEFESVAHYQRAKPATTGGQNGDTDGGRDSRGAVPGGRDEGSVSEQELQRTSTPVGDERASFQMPTVQASPIVEGRTGNLSESKTTVSDYKSVPSEAGDSLYVSVDQETTETDPSTRGSLNLTDIYGNRKEQDEDSEVEDNEVLYHVLNRESGGDLSIVVSDKSIKEKDMVGKTKTRWGIKTLEACERCTSSCITLTFDTMKRDKRERLYEMEPHDCQLLEYRLRNILSQRPLSEMNQRLYKCVVCNAKFSREFNTKRMFDDLQCPECRGGYCIEIKDHQFEKETGTVIADQPVESSSKMVLGETSGANSDGAGAVPGTSGTSVMEPAVIRASPSKTSLESSESFNDSSSCSRISQPGGSSCDSNQSVAGSTNSERDRDADLLGNESDIEVLSNPSQSSIEVLDRGYNPSRKASEERRISSVEPMNDRSVDSASEQTISGVQVQQLRAEISKITLDPDALTNTVVTTTKAEGKEDTSVARATNSGAKQPAAHVSKRGFMANVNLTESSSSGSVTDSVCTAYESTQGLPTDSPAVRSVPKEPTSAAGDPSRLVDHHAPGEGREHTERVPAASAGILLKADSSVLTSVLGGLFQSTNMLMAKNPKGKSDESLLNKLFEPIRYNYSDFANVDHRLKLYLYQSLFEDANESLKWLVSCIVFDDNFADEWPSGFDGLFIMSTTKFYVLKKVAAENDDPSSWLKKHIAGTIDRVGIAQLLPWKVGMKFIISAIGGVHVVLQDILRTDRLILFFNENPLPQYCTLDCQPSDLLNGKLRKASNGEAVKMVMVINFGDVLSNDELQTVQLSTLLVTENRLMLTPDIRWLNESSAYPVEPKFSQLMTNIVELEDVNELSCRLNYVDEQEDKCETWTVDFATPTAKESTISTICHLWENIFGVPLYESAVVGGNRSDSVSRHQQQQQ